MRRRFAGVLAMLLVLALGATTVFASNSPTAEDILQEGSKAGISAVSSSGKSVNITKAPSSKEIVDEAKSAAKAAVKDTAGAEKTQVLAVFELSSTEDAQTIQKGVMVTLRVSGVKSDSKIVVLHKLSSGWETIKPLSVGEGIVTFVATSLSPFAIASVPATVKDGDIKYDRDGTLPGDVGGGTAGGAGGSGTTSNSQSQAQESNSSSSSSNNNQSNNQSNPQTNNQSNSQTNNQNNPVNVTQNVTVNYPDNIISSGTGNTNAAGNTGSSTSGTGGSGSTNNVGSSGSTANSGSSYNAGYDKGYSDGLSAGKGAHLNSSGTGTSYRVTKTSPKTGASLPVLLFTAVFAAAGIAVCGRKAYKRY